jgi:hypothetical protein
MPPARPMLAPMGASNYGDIRDSLPHMYLEAPAPGWSVSAAAKLSPFSAPFIFQGVLGNLGLQKLFASASDNERPLQIASSTPNCGNLHMLRN